LAAARIRWGLLLRERRKGDGEEPTHKGREGRTEGLVVRGTEGREERREGTEREGEGIPKKSW